MEKNVGSVDIEELRRAREELNQERGIETDPNMYNNYNPNRAKEAVSAGDAESPQPEIGATEEQSFSESSNDSFGAEETANSEGYSGAEETANYDGYSGAEETANYEASSGEPDGFESSEETSENSDTAYSENSAGYEDSAEQNVESEQSDNSEDLTDAEGSDVQSEEGIDIDLSDDDMSLDDILDKLMENSEKQQSTAASNGGFGVLSDGSEPASAENSMGLEAGHVSEPSEESASLATDEAQSMESAEPEQAPLAVEAEAENAQISNPEIPKAEESVSENFANNVSGEKDFSVYDNFAEFEVKGYAPITSASTSTDEFKNLLDDVMGSADPIAVKEGATSSEESAVNEETEQTESEDSVAQTEEITEETAEVTEQETSEAVEETQTAVTEEQSSEQAETEAKTAETEETIASAQEAIQAESSVAASEASENTKAEEATEAAEEAVSEPETETSEPATIVADEQIEAVSEPEQISASNDVAAQAATETANKKESSEEKLKLIKDYKFSSALKDAEFKESDDFSFLLGKGENNKLMFTALCDMNNIAVFGANRAEAFSLMGTIICSLQTKLGVNEFNYVICDSSIDSEFDVFDSSSYMFFSRVAKTNREILDILVELENELDSRYGTLVEAKARSIEHYNEYAKNKGIEPMPYIVLLFNNYTRASSLKLGEQINESLSNILRLGRLVGIYAIVSAGEEIENKSINLNLASRICYKCDSEEMSNFAVGSDDAVKLSEEQEFIYSSVENDDLYHLKSPIFTKADATQTIKNSEK